MKFLKWISPLAITLLLCSSVVTHKNDEQLFRCVNKIVRLVEWKEKNTASVFKLGFIGDHHLYKISKSYFRGKTYHGKPILVQNYTTEQEIVDNQPRMLYIGKHKHADMNRFGELCSEMHVFSVADDQTEVDKLPLVVLHVNQSEEVEMIVNKTEAEKQSFKLSYHLLRAAKVVK